MSEERRKAGEIQESFLEEMGDNHDLEGGTTVSQAGLLGLSRLRESWPLAFPLPLEQSRVTGSSVEPIALTLQIPCVDHWAETKGPNQAALPAPNNLKLAAFAHIPFHSKF